MLQQGALLLGGSGPFGDDTMTSRSRTSSGPGSTGSVPRSVGLVQFPGLVGPDPVKTLRHLSEKGGSSAAWLLYQRGQQGLVVV